MGRFLALALVAVFVFPAAAGLDAAPARDGAAAPVPAGAAPPPAKSPTAPRNGPPLLYADPRAWIPVLAATGDPGQADQAAAASLSMRYSLAALGDADKDGLADYIVESRKPGTPQQGDQQGTPDQVSIALHSGARDHPVLWSYAIGAGGWYVIDDADGDGVDDVVVEKAGAPSQTMDDTGAVVAGTFHYGYAVDVESILLSGATGQKLFSHPTSFKVTFDDTYAGVLVGGVDDFQFTYEASFLERLGKGSWKGVDLVGIRRTSESTFAFAVLAFGGLFQDAAVNHLERLDLKGQTVWSRDVDFSEQLNRLMDVADYTGDGQPDFLFSSLGVAKGVAAEIVYTGLPPYEETRAMLVDGATGEVKWDVRSAKFLGEGEAVAAGTIRAGKRDVLLLGIGKESDDNFQTYGSRITVLDGATGATVSTHRFVGEFVLASEFGDVDHDGSSELLLLRVKGDSDPSYDSKADLQAVKAADYEPRWTLAQRPLEEIESFDPMHAPDFNGDGIPDILLSTRIDTDGDKRNDATQLEAIDGASGGPLWTYVRIYKVQSLEIVKDVTGDGGADLAVTWFDRPATPTDPKAQKEFDKSFNITNYPGFFELHRGKDLGLAWKKHIHEPRADVSARFVFVDASAAGDTNGNGVPDVLFNLDTPRCEYAAVTQKDGSVRLTLTCDPAKLGTKVHLNFALLIDGADGATLATYPAQLPSNVAELQPVVLGDAAPKARLPHVQPQDKGGPLPGFETFAALAAVACVGLAVGRRRR